MKPELISSFAYGLSAWTSDGVLEVYFALGDLLGSGRWAHVRCAWSFTVCLYTCAFACMLHRAFMHVPQLTLTRLGQHSMLVIWQSQEQLLTTSWPETTSHGCISVVFCLSHVIGTNRDSTWNCICLQSRERTRSAPCTRPTCRRPRHPRATPHRPPATARTSSSTDTAGDTAPSPSRQNHRHHHHPAPARLQMASTCLVIISVARTDFPHMEREAMGAAWAEGRWVDTMRVAG